MTFTLPIYLGYDFQSIGSVTVDYEYVEGENAYREPVSDLHINAARVRVGERSMSVSVTDAIRRVFESAIREDDCVVEE